MLKRIRSVLRWAIPLVLMPLFVVLGGGLMGERFYAWGILGMVLLTQGLYFVSFEKRNTGARRLAVAAVMTALSVLGRIVLAPIPGFKPITIIKHTIIFLFPQLNLLLIIFPVPSSFWTIEPELIFAVFLPH